MVSFAGKAKASKPGQAGTPTITSQAPGQVGISWTAPAFSGGAPISDYVIEYSSNGGSSWTEWIHTPSAATSATVTGLPDYLTYIFRVTAKNAVGLGNSSGNSAGAAQFNSATGGSESTISNYNGTGQTWKVHSFTSNSSLNVVSGNYPFSVLAVGAGYNGGGASAGCCGDYYAGGGGSGGKVLSSSTASLSNSVHTVTIGSSNGANSSVGSYSSSSGSAGGSGGSGSHTYNSNGSGGSNGPISNITGTSLYYAGGGGGGRYAGGGANYGFSGYPGGERGGASGGGGYIGCCGDYYGYAGGNGTQNTGGGGGGGGAAPASGSGNLGGGGAGGSGIVVVAYRIS